jgi:hypothetical protein
MILDHIGLYYSDRLPANLCFLLRVLGSLALPLFAYSFTLGFCRTKNAKNYFLRILILAFGSQLIIFLLLPLVGMSNNPLALNSVFSLVLAFAVLYGCEMLFAIPPDLIGSLKLLVANASTHSDRYDVRIGNGFCARTDLPGIYIPEWPLGVQFLVGIGLIAVPITAAFILPIEYGVLGVLSVLLFYLVDKRIPKNKSTWAFFGFFGLTLLYITAVTIATGTVSAQGAGAAAIFLCFLPNREKRPSRAVQAAFYAFYPLHIILLLLLRLAI